MQQCLNWEGRGYFGCPSSPEKFDRHTDVLAQPWLHWQTAFDRARQGDFRLIPQLLSAYERSPGPLFSFACCTLLGDAGPNRCFTAAIQELEKSEDFEKELSFCDMLATRGRLADVLVLLRVYERVASIADSDFLCRNLSDMLEPVHGVLRDPSRSGSFKRYRARVMSRYNRLVDRLGSDQFLVFKGGQFGVERLARGILKYVRQQLFDSVWRRKFEASTGIDCSAFYENGILQPLSCATLVEEFLESPQAGQYEDGVRYFFGHRIPD